MALRVTENSSGQAYAPPTDQENTTGSRRHPISVCVYSKWQSQGRSELGTWRTAANKRGPQTLSIAQSNPQILLQSETASPPRIERPRVALLMGGDRDCLHSSVCSNVKTTPRTFGRQTAQSPSCICCVRPPWFLNAKLQRLSPRVVEVWVRGAHANPPAFSIPRIFDMEFRKPINSALFGLFPKMATPATSDLPGLPGSRSCRAKRESRV